jgi:hypothetical protein
VLKKFENSFFEFSSVTLFLHKSLQMEQTKKYRGIWWLVFLASTAALLFAIYSHWEWLTLILPFQTTSFVKALDIM